MNRHLASTPFRHHSFSVSPAVTVVQMSIPFLLVPLDSAPYFCASILGVLTFATVRTGLSGTTSHTTWTLQDSNLWPTGYEPVSLPTELSVQNGPAGVILLTRLALEPCRFCGSYRDSRRENPLFFFRFPGAGLRESNPKKDGGIVSLA